MSDLSQLVCLPPAGAGPSLFRPWQQNDPNVIAPAIPGREALFREAAPTDLATLADNIADRVAPTLGKEYGIFGYSLGGTLAYLLAERLVARGLPAPNAAFTLGALAPHRLAQGTEDILALDGQAFWAQIARIGGTPPEILNDAGLRALFEPGLRADSGCAAPTARPKAAFAYPVPLRYSLQIMTIWSTQRAPLIGPNIPADMPVCTLSPAGIC
ncbi:thioesterase II family protein [Pseudorhodobacter aquimaris]|uniref:thioesterase II family protein n=1 Tax=Pseudorhodobacter aquimaris TaxID=687412 RepID=UPI00067C7110|nr:thioesterase domain-containing protein [Pseudorhodobacter aquimaris]